MLNEWTDEDAKQALGDLREYCQDVLENVQLGPDAVLFGHNWLSSMGIDPNDPMQALAMVVGVLSGYSNMAQSPTSDIVGEQVTAMAQTCLRTYFDPTVALVIPAALVALDRLECE